MAASLIFVVAALSAYIKVILLSNSCLAI